MQFNYLNPKRRYHGKRVDIFSIETPGPKGNFVEKEIIVHPGAVVILPLLKQDEILLIRNERPAVLDTLWELPAGTLDPEESVYDCAARELEEETGYKSQNLSYLMEFFSTPGFCNEVMTVFTARELTYVGQRLDETEKIEVFPISFQQALSMIESQEICDAKTISVILYYLAFQKGKDAL